MSQLSLVPAVSSDVEVEMIAGFFWISHFGYVHENRDYMFMNFEAGQNNYAANVITKNYLTTNKDSAKELEWTRQEFCIPPAELLSQDKIRFSKNTTPKEPEYRSVDLPWSNVKGVKIPQSPQFCIYHPADYLTCSVVEEMVREFAKEYKIVPLLGKVKFKDAPDEQQFRRETEKTIAEGGIQMNFAPFLLEQFFSPKEMARFKEIQEGFMREGQVYVRLKDGSEHLIGKPNLKLVK